MVDDEARFELTEAQRAELDRRLTDRTARGTPGSDWSEVKRRILKKT
ncbi:MAG: hypothetical protein ACOY3P_14425 [Planctomycetota bacterium]